MDDIIGIYDLQLGSRDEEPILIPFLNFPVSARMLVVAHISQHVGNMWLQSKGHSFALQTWVDAFYSANPGIIEGKLPALRGQDIAAVYELLLQLEPLPENGMVGAGLAEVKQYSTKETNAILRKELAKRWPGTKFCVRLEEEIETCIYYYLSEAAPSFAQLKELTDSYLFSDETEDEMMARVSKTHQDMYDAPPAYRIHITAEGEQERVVYGLIEVQIYGLDELGQIKELYGNPGPLWKAPADILRSLKSKK